LNEVEKMNIGIQYFVRGNLLLLDYEQSAREIPDRARVHIEQFYFVCPVSSVTLLKYIYSWTPLIRTRFFEVPVIFRTFATISRGFAI